MRSNVKPESAIRGRHNVLKRTETDNDFDRRPMCDNVSKTILVVDVETTGLDPAKDTVVQIAACKLNGSARLDDPPFVTYVRPEVRISDTAEAVHGLNLTDLRTAPSIVEAICAFNEYAPPGAILCGHNIAFDAAFLKAAYALAGIRFPSPYRCLDVIFLRS